MATRFLDQSLAEEKLAWFGIASTYPIYLLGGVYVMGSVIGWLILMVVTLRYFTRQQENPQSLNIVCWVWIVMMMVMLLCLLVGHSNWSLGIGKTIKSSIGWAKGWALFAVFICLGAVSSIRPEIVIRATCVVAIHSLIFAVISVMAYVVGLPGDIYISPLKVVGGPGEAFFKVSLFGINPETGMGRWQFFGPWAPSAGLLSCLFLVICSLEKDRRIRYWAFAGCVAVGLLSQSRAGWAIFIMLIPMLMFGETIRKPWFMLFAGVVIPAVLLLGQPLFEHVMDSYQAIKEARPDSTRVRNTLARLAVQRWEDEAFWFGHGIVEKGPKIVEFMPIGSHHSWYGLLFVKGLIGCLALAIPMILTAFVLFILGGLSRLNHAAFCLVVVLLCYSFFENLEILVYLCWPALLIIGMALNPRKLGVSHV